MKDTIKLITIAVVAGLVSGIIVALVGGGNQLESVGGGTRYPSGLSTNGTAPVDGELRTDYITTDGASGSATSTFTSASYSIGGADYYDISGSFDDASTTLKSILNPFRATTTVMYSTLEITGTASTSLLFGIATSTNGQFDGGNLLGCSTANTVASNTCDGVIIDDAIIATTTDCTVDGTGCSGGYGTITSNGSSLLNINGTDTNGSGSTPTPLIVGPNEYVMIFATTTYNDVAIQTNATTDATSDGITNTGNTFDGTYLLRFLKP